ncbi:MAG: hypothetical protein IPP72_10095 [Chitinophagaceae bacterium]|nr:hypothetical protein [Chitinophagaceae bacterium]
MKQFLFILLLLATLHGTAQISFYTDQPRTNDVITGNTLTISGFITYAASPVVSMIAVSNGVLDTLSFSQPGPGQFDYGYFSGSISVAGFPQNVPIKLKVTGTTLNGSMFSDSVNYQCNYTPPGPVAKILYPTAGTNAYPVLPIRTSHTGNDTCTSYLEVKVNSTIILRDTLVNDDFDTSINISRSQTGSVQVSLKVKDKWNQTSSTSIYIFSDDYLYMTPLYTGIEQIRDYNYHRILETRSDALYLIPDSNLLQQEAMPNSKAAVSAYCTPYGAIWTESSWGAEPTEYTNGVFYPGVNFDNTAGRYVVYSSTFSSPQPGCNFIIKDLLTRATTTAGGTIGSGSYQDPVVAENGLVVYAGVDGIGLGSSNVTVMPSTYNSIIGAPMGTSYFYSRPVTDGKNVLFLETPQTPQTYKIYWNNGASNTVLSDLGEYSDPFNPVPPSPAYYTVANNFIAYLKKDANSILQVWFRDSTGVSTQVSNSVVYANSIRYLNNDGDLMYVLGGETFYLKYGSNTPRSLGGISGRIMYRDGGWYVIRGRYLYKLNVDAFRTVANGNWTDAASWENGLIPASGADVIVTTNIVVNTNVVCNSLRVVPPGSITVASGIILTVLH